MSRRVCSVALLVCLAGCGNSPEAGSTPDGGGDATVLTGTFELAWEDNFDAFDAA